MVDLRLQTLVLLHVTWHVSLSDDVIREEDTRFGCRPHQLAFTTPDNELLCFRISRNRVNFYMAYLSCRVRGGHMAYVKDNATDAFLKENMLKQKIGKAWLGATDRHKEGQWRWLDGSLLGDYQPWRRREPNNWRDQDCLALVGVQRSTWGDKDCQSQYNYICQFDPSKQKHTAICPRGLFPVGRSCFWISRIRKRFHEARENCNLRGGLLASIGDSLTQEHIMYYTRYTRQKGMYWIGLSDTLKEDDWRWDDNQEMSFQYWAPKEPNNLFGKQHCGALWSQRGTWFDRFCWMRYFFICRFGNRGSQIYDSTGSCQAGHHAIGNTCYQLVKKAVTYEEASQSCRRNFGQLVTVTTKRKQDELDVFLGRLIRFKQSIWIGLSNMVAGKFQWVNYKALKFANWLPNTVINPELLACAEVIGVISKTESLDVENDVTYKWRPSNCRNKRYFICEYARREMPDQPPRHSFRDVSTDSDGGYTRMRTLSRRLPATYRDLILHDDKSTGDDEYLENQDEEPTDF